MAERLKKKVQVFIVQLLACYETPSDVAMAVKDEFDLEISRQRVEYYDPRKRIAATGLSDELTKLFWDTQEKYNQQEADKGLGSLNHRLARLGKMLNRVEAMRNYQAAMNILKQAAQDKGGVFTNKREHSGPNGGAIPIDLGDKSKVLAGQMLKRLVDKGMKEEEARASLISMGVNEHDIPTSLNI